MTLQEYMDTIVMPYRAAVLNGEDPEPVFVDANVTCHTNGCSAENYINRILLAENADGVYRVSCGMCETNGINNPITDIVLYGYNGQQFTV